MWKFNKSLSRQSLILGSALSFAGALSAIGLLTACSQQPASGVHALKSPVPDTAATSPPATLKSVKEKPLVSQQTKEATLTSQSTLRSCEAGNLQAVLDEVQGAAGSLYGTIKFTNSADTACVVEGRPQIQLLNSSRQSLPVNEKDLQSGDVGSRVIVQPGQNAYLTYKWVNWCLKEANNDIKLVVNLPGSQGQVPVILPDKPEYHNTPPCNGAGEPSSLSVGLFSPKPSP
jgi:hypothetical protein